jgi:hypothetical protein
MAYLRGSKMHSKMRSMIRSSASLFLLLGACVVGEAPPNGNGSGSNVERNTCEPRAATPAAAFNHVSDPTGPRAGAACLDAACHAQGGPGGQFAFAGTVYKDSGAQAPAAGVTIQIYTPDGKSPLAEAITDTAGNFVIRQPAMFQAFPYETQVSGCGPNPPIKPMISQITAAEANCNLGGSCHGAGGGAGVIDLPDPP